MREQGTDGELLPAQRLRGEFGGGLVNNTVAKLIAATDAKMDRESKLPRRQGHGGGVSLSAG